MNIKKQGITIQTIKFIASSILLMVAFQTQASYGLSDIKIKNGIYYHFFTGKYLTGYLKAIEANKLKYITR